MIHYHGTPITPEHCAMEILRGRHALVSFAHPEQLGTVTDVCSSFVADNGAFPAWKSGRIIDWAEYVTWVRDMCMPLPNFDWCIIPDVIDGSEEENDRLVNGWSLPPHLSAPVWHLHESLDRLERLMYGWPRICFGSSGQYASVGTAPWFLRMQEAMRVVCDSEGKPLVKLHGLRMLSPRVFTKFPFTSADSSNIARNIGIDANWKGTYKPPTKTSRGILIASRIEFHQSPMRYIFDEPISEQSELELWECV